MTAAELAIAAGSATDVIRDLTAKIDNERHWLQALLREIAERAGVAPTAEDDED